MEIIIKKIKEKYQITKKICALSNKSFITKHKIYAEKDIKTNTLTVYNNKGEFDFKFKNSKPETIKAIAKLLIKASEIVKSECDTANQPVNSMIARVA